jgi:hypothetical protein
MNRKLAVLATAFLAGSSLVEQGCDANQAVDSAQAEPMTLQSAPDEWVQVYQGSLMGSIGTVGDGVGGGPEPIAPPKTAHNFESMKGVSPDNIRYARQAIQTAQLRLANLDERLGSEIHQLGMKISVAMTQDNLQGKKERLRAKKYEKVHGRGITQYLAQNPIPESTLMALMAMKSRFDIHNPDGLFELNPREKAAVDKYFSHNPDNYNDPVDGALAGMLSFARWQKIAANLKRGIDPEERDVLAYAISLSSEETIRSVWKQFDPKPVNFTHFELLVSGAVSKQLGSKGHFTMTDQLDTDTNVRYLEMRGVAACLDPKYREQLKGDFLINGRPVVKDAKTRETVKLGEVAQAIHHAALFRAMRDFGSEMPEVTSSMTAQP